MNIDRTGQSGAGPSSLSDAGNTEESSAALARNRSASGMQAKPPLQRVRKSGRPLPDAAIRQAAAPAEERKFGFTDLPIELMFKIRSKLGQGDAARLVETSKSMNEVFTPRVKADYLQYLARHPENSPHPSNTPAERVTYFVDLIRQTQEVPEELRAPVLQDVLVHAYEHCLADDGGFEHVASAYLESTDFILDRRSRFALLCHFGEMLESAGFRQRFVDRNGPHIPRPDVMEMARHFHRRCLLLMNEPRRSEEYPIAGIATPTDLDKDTSARARWAEHVAMHPGDIHALHAIRTSSLFMYPANERLQRWRSIVQQGLWIPAHLRAPLLEKLCATTTELGSADDGLAAMAEVLEFSRSVTAPGAQAMAIGRLTAAVLGLYQAVQDEAAPAPAPEWRDRGLLLLLAAASKLPPEVRLSHQAPLIEAITDLGSSGRVSIFDIVLNNVSDLNSVDQGGLDGGAGRGIFRHSTRSAASGRI